MFLMVGAFFSIGNFYWEGRNALSKNSLNFLMTYDNLHNKGETNRFNGQQDPFV